VHVSPAKLLAGDLSSVRDQKSTMKKSKRAQKVKVATRTDVAEVWVPLVGAGSDARLLVKLQGAVLFHCLKGLICPE
jgi:hypothetical protein